MCRVRMLRDGTSEIGERVRFAKPHTISSTFSSSV